MKVRLFIAIPIPENIRKEIITYTKLPDNFKITKKENLHITMLFLGDTEYSRIPEITGQIEEAMKNYASFEIEISRFGQFPPNGYPGIIYASGDRALDKLTELASRIRDNLKKLGFFDNKPFKYHVTVARQKDRSFSGRVTIPEFKNKLCHNVDQIILYKSDLKPNGPVYTEVWSKELKKIK